MPVSVLTVDLRISQSTSLKDKRSVIRHLLMTARQRFGASASELSHHDLRQRSELGFVLIGRDAAHLTEQLDEIERFIDDHLEVVVLDRVRYWLELDE